MNGKAFGLGLLLAAATAAPVKAATCQSGLTYDNQGHPGLKVTGTAGKQTVVIALDETTTILFLDCNGDGDFVDPGDINGDGQGTVEWLDLQLGGADTITVRLIGGLGSISKLLRVVLGPGTNVFNVESVGPFSVPSGTRFTIDIVGGPGVDKPTVDLSPLHVSGGISLRADLAGGNDVMGIKAPILESGGVFSVDVALGPGANALAYTDNIVNDGATEHVDIQGDASGDNVAFNLGHLHAGRTFYTVDLGPGSDVFTANVDLGNFVLFLTQPLHLTVNGGPGNDTITVGRNGTTGPAPIGNILELDLQGGAGNDAITVDFGAGGLSYFNLGGERLRVDGGSGSDTLNVTLNGTTAVTASHDISINGGAMADKINFTQDVGGTGTHTWVTGAALIDGSFGTPDVCTVAGSAAANAHKRNCEQ